VHGALVNFQTSFMLANEGTLDNQIKDAILEAVVVVKDKPGFRYYETFMRSRSTSRCSLFGWSRPGALGWDWSQRIHCFACSAEGLDSATCRLRLNGLRSGKRGRSNGTDRLETR
jgi:hypothetical protein